MREGVQTDHWFELSPYCDCDDCNVFCHYHYGLEDACLLERYMHQENAKAEFLVCGPTNTADSTEDACSKCGAAVYPTIGSHARARREGVALICMDCWRKLPNSAFAGVMGHGKMLSGEAVREIIAKARQGKR
jgi:hypothetical protein